MLRQDKLTLFFLSLIVINRFTN